MPPISPQGSRTGLITWMAVCAILVFPFTLLALFWWALGQIGAAAPGKALSSRGPGPR